MKLNESYVAIIPLHVDDHVDNMSIVVEMVRQILNLDAVFGIFLISKNHCLAIGRSINDTIDVGLIMRSIGGGGHSGAGSAMTKSINPGVVAAWIRILISGRSSTGDQAGQLMNSPVLTVSPKTTMEEAITLFQNRSMHGAPAVENGRLVGMISLRDLSKLKKKSQYQLPVKAFMSVPVHTIEPWKSPAAAAHLMVRHDIGRLPVVENGTLVGIISRSDAMNHFYGRCPLRACFNELEQQYSTGLFKNGQTSL